MKGLTDKQRAILDFIEDFMEKEVMAPTVYEIADHFKIKTSTVFAHLRSLQRKKFLARSSKARSISLLRPKKKSRHRSFVVHAPLLNKLSPELKWTESIDDKDGEVPCDPAWLDGVDIKKVFVMNVKDDSMRELGIVKGDLVFAKAPEHPKAGDILVVSVNGETYVRSYFPLNDSRLELRPANPAYSTQTYPSDQVLQQGIVLALQRKY